MLKRASNSDSLLDTADYLIRQQGLAGITHEQLAISTGVPIREIHAKFPGSCDIEAIVLQRYIDRFFQILGDPAQQTLVFSQALDTYIAAFQAGILEAGEMFVLLVLGEKEEELPTKLQNITCTFSRRARLWLADLLEFSGNCSPEDALMKSDFILAAMEVAVLMCQSNDDAVIFENLSKNIHRICET